MDQNGSGNGQGGTGIFLGKADGEWKPWYDEFILELRISCSPAKASTALNIELKAVADRHRAACPRFAELWDKAINESAGKLLEEVALHRAIYGWQVAVYHKGECCGYRQMHSNTLLMSMLRAHKPDKYLLEAVAGATGTHEEAAQAIIDARNRITVAMRDLGDN